MRDFHHYHLCWGYPYGECYEIVPLKSHYCPKCRKKSLKDAMARASQRQWYKKTYGFEEMNLDENYEDAIYAG